MRHKMFAKQGMSREIKSLKQPLEESFGSLKIVGNLYIESFV